MSATIRINALAGTANASGAGPTTAITGSNASYSSKTVTLDGSPTLSGVATDGTHVLYLQTSTGRRFFTIVGVNDGADTVTVSEDIAGTASGLSWAIGGSCSSINSYLQADVKDSWVIELESNLEVSSSLNFNIGTFTIKSDTDNLVRTIKGDSTDVIVLTPTADSKNITFQNVKITGEKSHPSRWYEFDGTNDHVLGPTIDLGAKCSVAFWMRSNAVPGTGSLTRQSIFSNAYYNFDFVLGNDGGSGYQWLCYYGDGTAGALGVNYVFHGTLLEAALPVVNTWEHFVISIDKTQGKMWIYKNGILCLNGSTNNYSFTTSASVSKTYKLGDRAESTSQFFDGGLADVKVYTSLLTEKEVSDVYRGATLGTEVLDFRCGDQDPVEAYDSGPNKLHGVKTSIDTGTFHGEDEAFLTNKFPVALYFDGVDDKLVTERLVPALSENKITVAFWANIPSSNSAQQNIVTVYGFAVYKNGATQKTSLYTPTDTNMLHSSSLMPRDVWFHVVAVYDEGVAKIYIDGALDSQSSGNSTDFSVIPPTKLYAGIASNESSSRVVGNISNIQLFKTPLTEEEVLQLYVKGTCNSKPYIHLPLDDGSGTSVTELVDSNPGVLSGTPVWYSKAPYNSNTNAKTGLRIQEGSVDNNVVNLVGCVIGDKDDVIGSGIVNNDPSVSLRTVNNNVQYCSGVGVDSQGPWTTVYTWIHNCQSYGALIRNAVTATHCLITKNAHGLILDNVPLSLVSLVHTTVSDNAGEGIARLVNGSVTTSLTEQSGGIIATSRKFDGVDDYLDAGIVGNPCQKDFSLAAWLKADTISDIAGVAGKANNSDGSNFRYGLGVNEQGKAFGLLDAGTPWISQSRARTFDGTNDYVSLTTPSFVELGTEDFTLSVWAKSSSAATGNNNTIVINKTTGYFYQAGLQLTMNASGSFIRIGDGTNYSEALKSTNYCDGNWHHIVGIRKSGTLYLYVDGVLVDSSDCSNVGSITSDYKFSVGALNIGSLYHQFTGQIADVILLTRAITPSEVSSLGQDPVLSDCLVRFKLDEGVEGLVFDSSPNRFALTSSSPAIYSGNDIPVKTSKFSGKRITRYKDLGHNGSIQIADDAAFNLSTNLSASIWAKHTYSAPAASQILISKNLSGSNQEWTMYFLTSKKLRVVLSSNGSTANVWESTSAYSGDLTDWHHYAFTYNASTLKVYIDGVEVAGSYTSGSHPASLYNGTANVELGSDNNKTGNWQGALADAKIYSQTLTATEVLEDYVDQLPYTPVGRWKLDELSKDEALDSGSGGNDATTLQNILVKTTDQVVSYAPREATSDSKDIFGNVLSFNNVPSVSYPLISGNDRVEPGRWTYVFDGVNDCIVSGSSLNQTTLTVCMWIKCADPAANQPHVSNRDASGTKGFWFGRTSAHKMYFYHYAGSPQSAIGPTTLPENTWAHLAYVIEGTNVRFYLNGALDYSTTITGITADAINAWYVGKDGAGSSVYAGSLSDIRIYSEALSLEQIKLIYEQRDNEAALPQPEVWYQGERDKIIAWDYSGNNNHGVKTNVTTSFTSTDTTLPVLTNNLAKDLVSYHRYGRGSAGGANTAITVTGSQTNYDGVSDASLLENTGTGGKAIYGFVVPSNAYGLKASFIVKDVDAGPSVTILLRNNTEALNYLQSDFNLDTETPGSFGEIQSLGNDWYKITATLYGYLDAGDTVWVYLYCGTSTSAIGTQLLVGSYDIQFLKEAPVDSTNPRLDVHGEVVNFPGSLQLAPCISLSRSTNDILTASAGASDILVNKMSFWFYSEKDIHPNWTAGEQIIGTYDASIAYLGICFGPATGSLSGETITVLTSTTHRIGTTKTFKAGWHFLEIIWDGSEYEIHVDGISETTISVDTAARLNARKITVGAQLAGSGLPSQVKVADLKVWDDSDELVLHYPLTEGHGTNCYEVCGNGPTLVLTNGTVSTAWSTLQGVATDYNTIYGCKHKFQIDNTNWSNPQTTVTTGQTDPKGGTNAFKLACTTSGPDNVNLVKFCKDGGSLELWIKNVSGNRCEVGLWNGSSYVRCFAEVLEGSADITYVLNRAQFYNLSSDWIKVRIWTNITFDTVYIFPGRHTSGSATDAVIVAFIELQPTHARVPYLLDRSGPADSSSIVGHSGNRLAIPGNSGLQPVTNGSNTLETISTTTVVDNTWHHVCLTVDRDGEMSLYVDGALEATRTVKAWQDMSIESNEGFTVGTLGDYFFPGNVSGVRYFESALSSSQVLSLYQGSLATTPTLAIDGNESFVAVVGSPIVKSQLPTVVSNSSIGIFGSNFSANNTNLGLQGTPLVAYVNSYGGSQNDTSSVLTELGALTVAPGYTDSVEDKFTPSRALKNKGPETLGQDGTTKTNVDLGGPQRSEQRNPIVRRNGMNLNM